MKKLFTLIAFLTCFLGAKAGEVIVDKTVDYSTYNGFPFYVMGYVPEWINGVMTDFGANYRYAKQADLDGDGDAKWKDGESSEATVKTNDGTEYQKVTGAGPYWHQYFIANGIPTEIGGSCTVKALVKASEACSIPLQMRWSWSADPVSASADVPQSDDFVEVTWEFSGIDATSCDLIAQPGTSTAIIEWKSLTVSHEQEEGVVQTWLQMITDNGNAAAPDGDGKYVGDAEFGAWPSWALELTDGINANWRTDRAGEICAWALTMGTNFDDQNTAISEDSPRSRPYPAPIEAEAGNESNHVFAVHVTQIAPIEAPKPDEASVAWSNQFWIESPKTWKAGTKIRIKFRYKASTNCSVGTQIHKLFPSDYLYWHAFDDLSFTTEWQEFNKTIDFDSNTGGGASLCFNLNADATNGRTAPIDFYFDDLSWEVLKLDEGLFVAAKDTRDGAPAYDVNAAKQFVPDPDDEEGEVEFAVVGKEGDPDSWVNELMISTFRGDKSAFNGGTISAKGDVKNGEWMNYESKSQATIKLPAAGVWRIDVAQSTSEICFTQIEGEEIVVKEPVDVVTNATEVKVNGKEREDLIDSKADDGTITVREEADDPAGVEVGGEGHNGQGWDNQFFLVANRPLLTDEVTIIKFQYKANKAANSSTQLHGTPGAYKHWNAIGTVSFTEEWQDFETELKIPAEANEMQSIAFNMAEIKEACDYELKNFQWYLKNETEGKTLENLIDAEGTKNFYVKEGAGTDPREFGTESGIINVKKDAVKADDAIYNLAGQRVSKDYKGIVVKAGKKTLNF